MGQAEIYFAGWGVQTENRVPKVRNAKLDNLTAKGELRDKPELNRMAENIELILMGFALRDDNNIVKDVISTEPLYNLSPDITDQICLRKGDFVHVGLVQGEDDGEYLVTIKTNCEMLIFGYNKNNGETSRTLLLDSNHGWVHAENSYQEGGNNFDNLSIVLEASRVAAENNLRITTI